MASAKSITVAAELPLDQPQMQGHGLLYREDGAPGNASHLALPPEDPIRAKKGDLGLSHIAGFPSRPSFESPGTPFKKLR